MLFGVSDCGPYLAMMLLVKRIVVCCLILCCRSTYVH
nr:MAG TPA: membrane fusion protein [Caudoviricetes sp.]DAX55337.1 MAG TPA: membrane fusion protein [Caudoviricetes sp.]